MIVNCYIDIHFNCSHFGHDEHEYCISKQFHGVDYLYAWINMVNCIVEMMSV